MYKKLKKMLLYSIMLVTVLYSGFLYTLLFHSTLHFYDYGLFGALLVVAVLALLLGLVPGLIICSLVIIAYGSVIFFQMITGSGTIWTLHYFWFIIYPAVTFIAGEIREEMNRAKAQCSKCEHIADRIVTIDEITGYGNGREFYRELEIEMARSRRHKVPMVLFVLEIQYFEELLSIHGKNHTTKIYKAIADALNKATRTEDLRFRIDTDLLALILPHTTIETSLIVKKRIKDALSQIDVIDDNLSKNYNITLKIGAKAYDDSIPNPIEFKQLAKQELEYDV